MRPSPFNKASGVAKAKPAAKSRLAPASQDDADDVSTSLSPDLSPNPLAFIFQTICRCWPSIKSSMSGFH